ncbi:hypothetical protein [Streptomyces avidinii]
MDVEYDGAVYRLVPDSVPSSRLTRDGTHLGDFSSDGDETVIAEWREDRELRPADAAIGYALAAAFGTGAQPMWMMIVDGVSSALPPARPLLRIQPDARSGPGGPRPVPGRAAREL